ncbi:hypothetical protein [Alicyclobacillus vulcanalis]|uniref:Uncharacterized protein n=1 Tax=Alicyclobacillus vulcanalis TaxID=252246 RepID=A0A1N7MRP7_9BACL|nr:hypothetical protein [Alicyclobacillus vulcanalis]SIS88519.1 hypothetical protein SAMN05421799_10642 [Alicyclobacillus vulcanalis]
MRSDDIKNQIDKLKQEVTELKAEIHDRLEAIKHLLAVYDAMVDEETKANASGPNPR